MNMADFRDLERRWMGAVQTRDKEELQQLLDERFVSTSWSSHGELTSREEYLASVDSAEFGCFTVNVDHVQRLGDTAVVRCRLQCDCIFGERCWHASFLVTDVWQHHGERWKAVSRHVSLPIGELPSLIAQGLITQQDPLAPGDGSKQRKHSSSPGLYRRSHAEGA